MADGYLPPIVISVALADAPALAGLAGLKGAVADTAASIDVSTAAASKSMAGMGAGAATGAEAIGVNAAKAGKSLEGIDRKSTRLNSSHLGISYAVFCLK